MSENTTDSNEQQGEALELPADLARKITVQGQCWIWKGSKRRGYGSTSLNGKTITAHRYSHLKFIGPIPDGLYVLHRRMINRRTWKHVD